MVFSLFCPLYFRLLWNLTAACFSSSFTACFLPFSA